MSLQSRLARIERMERNLAPPPGRWFRVIIDRTEDGRQVVSHSKVIIEQQRDEADADFEARYRGTIGVGADDRVIVRRIIDPDQPEKAGAQLYPEPASS